MAFRTLIRITFIFVLAVWCFALRPGYTAASNARIIRLSLVQGDVRILHDSKGDPLANDKANWDRAELNLPIRQHDVVATDNGRAEVEFENGAMAFLNENSVLEFFDLSLDDGSFTTRLILRQGTASFYANPGRGDYFSVTGGDFTAEAGNHAGFRMDNFDDGSTIAVTKGQVSVLHKDDSTMLAKGQSLTMRADAGENESASMGRAPESDEFDRWVSGREDSVVTATNAALQYSNSSSYVSGFGDLYTYGGFYPVAGFGYGWQPYGVGIGWSPFDYGSWIFQSGFGWSFIGSQPWGWLPYHYGGWIFQPGIGWLWSPTGFGHGLPPVKFHAVTATFVRSGDAVGIVPSHPLDRGKTPVNLAQGVMPLTSRGGGAASALAATGSQWKVVKEPPANALVSHASVSSAPARTSRSVESRMTAGRFGEQPAGSSIAYDAREHRFVNSNVPTRSAAAVSEATSGKAADGAPASRSASASAQTAPGNGRGGEVSARQAPTVPTRTASSRVAPPPAAPRSGSVSWGGFSRGAANSGRGASMQGGARASAPAARASSGRAH